MREIAVNDKILIAHKAANSWMPENTFESMKRMEEKGARWFEIDCFLLKDGNIAVFHDLTLDRLTTGRGKITEKRASDLLNIFVYPTKIERIPLLSPLLAYANERNLHIMIEVKDKNPKIVKKIDQLMSAYNSDLFVIYSFHKEILLAFKQLQPKYSLRWNIEKLTQNKLGYAKKLGLGINLNRRFLFKSDIARITAAGLDLHVYTVNSRKEANKLFALGVKAIITDRLIEEKDEN